MQFLVILAVVAALVIADSSPREPVADVAPRLALALAAMAAVPALAAIGARLIARRAGRPSLARWFCRFRQAHSVLWLAAVVFVLYGLQWGRMVRGNWQLDRLFLVDELLILVPVVVPLVLSWAALYEAEVAVRRSGEGGQAVELPGRGRYVAMHVRFFLGTLLVPVVTLLAIQDALSLWAPEVIQADSPYAAAVFAPPLALLILLFPFLLRCVWRTRPLERGPLRERLEGAARRSGFKVREILVWDTGGMVANAAVAGFLPSLRYVFLTDGLLAQLSHEQVEAVFGHEVGHVRHRHLALRMLAMVTPLSLWVLLEQAYPEACAALSNWVAGAGVGSQIRIALATLAAMGVYMLVVFGAYCRMLETQADLFGCRTLALDPATEPVEVFISALEKLAAISGIDRNAPGWQHASIARRVDILNRAAIDPHYEQWLHRRLRLLGGIIAGVVLSPLVYLLLVG